VISPNVLDGQAVEWSDRLKYLGIYLASSKFVKFDINSVKSSFYVACNSVFSHRHGVDELALLLTLQESYSLSVLMYASPALSFNYKQANVFNVCWNSVIRRIFGYQRSEAVKDVRDLRT